MARLPLDRLHSFSPVAGIQWVETSFMRKKENARLVSVPLPGFSGLRLEEIKRTSQIRRRSFQSRCRDSVG